MIPAPSLGSVGCGLSIVLFVMAQRDLGAARTSALYATAPFLGMVLAVFLLGERPGGLFLLAIPLMLGGAYLMLREEHAHPHEHAALVHAHSHTPDLHHRHEH